jgi:ATP-dependent Zn protease
MKRPRSSPLEATAYHEAGHAVIGRILGLACGGATIDPAEGRFGYAVIENPLHSWTRGAGTRKALAHNFCIALYAGGEAERTLMSSQNIGDSVDCERVRSCLKMVGVRSARFVGDDVWERHEEKLRSKAARFVLNYRDLIEAVAQSLLNSKTLTAEEIDALVTKRRINLP